MRFPFQIIFGASLVAILGLTVKLGCAQSQVSTSATITSATITGTPISCAPGQSCQAYQVQLFVSPKGRAQGTGSETDPFPSLQAARDAVRALKGKTGGNLPQGRVVVWLMPGIHRIDKSVEFSSQDSGVHYRGYGSSSTQTRLVGGVRLEPQWFKPVVSSSAVWNRLDSTARRHIVEVNLPAHGITDFGNIKPSSALELFINDKRMPLGRWPDSDANTAAGSTTAGKAINHGFASINQAVSSTAFTYAGDRPNRWTNAPDFWLHGFWRYPWSDQHIAAQSLDTGTKTISLAKAPPSGIKAGKPFYAYNLLEEITEPGEWYLDHTTGIMYLYPTSNFNNSEIFVSMIPDRSLLKIRGASNLEFHDFVLEFSRKKLVWIESGFSNVLAGITVRHSGSSGVEVGGHDNVIRDSTVYDTGGTGVILNGGDRPSLTSSNNTLTNSKVSAFGAIEWSYSPGVSVTGVGQVVSHNRFQNAPHAAILFSGNNHLIEKNEIFNVLRFSSDAGAIYTGRDWGSRGNKVRNNFIHDLNTYQQGFGVYGIYLDDCASGIEVSGNVLYRISGAAILHGGGRDNIFANNVFARNGKALQADSRCVEWLSQGRPNNIPGDSWNLLEKIQMMNYQQAPWSVRYPSLAAIPNDWNALIAPGATWLYPEGTKFVRNAGYGNKTWISEWGHPLDHYAALDNNIENQDPLFVDEANLNLELQPASPVRQIPGWQEIPFAEIGPQP